ncbi:MAG: hypothetical protein LUE63_09640 [Lachnospiraceae bacterium]|nr:hypothetical protein [Lachnospiraceae bacterium]
MDFEPVLRAFAVQQYLQKKKLDNLMIEYKPESAKNYDVRHPLFSCVDHPVQDRRKQSARLKKWKRLFYDRERRYDKIQDFLSQKCEKADICYEAKAIRQAKPDADCYIVLRENPDENEIITGLPKEVFLIGYDAGGANARLNRHTALSPLFLFDSRFYSGISVKPEKTGYVLLYMTGKYDAKLAAAAVKFAGEHSLDLIELSEYRYDTVRRDDQKHPVLYDIGIEEWLGYMLNAGYIFTNSADGCALSIVFDKCFFAWKDASGKVERMMSEIGLSNRILSDLKETVNLCSDPDREAAEAVLREARMKAGNFLDSSLRKAHGAHVLLMIKRRYWRLRKNLGLK